MQIIKVDAIGSTNTFLKEAVRDKTITEPTCVWAKKQTEGKGQHGAKWKSKANKNLTFSVFLPYFHTKNNSPFIMNMLTTISIYNCLLEYALPNLKIKWPNDILSVNKKIGGILIENSYKNGELAGSIIGIGLNVNQDHFENLPQASSIKNITGKTLNIETLLNNILNMLNKSFQNYSQTDFKLVKKQFEKILFRNKKPSTFNAGGLDFTGIIQGITDQGKLIVMLEDSILKTYDLKEITLKY